MRLMEREGRRVVWLPSWLADGVSIWTVREKKKVGRNRDKAGDSGREAAGWLVGWWPNGGAAR